TGTSPTTGSASRVSWLRGARCTKEALVVPAVRATLCAMATATPLDMDPAGAMLPLNDVRRTLTPEQRAEADAATVAIRAKGFPDEVLFMAKDRAELDAWIRSTFGPEALNPADDPAELTELLQSLSACATTS